MKMIGLLRGINVGGNRKIPMIALCHLAESVGFSDVRHYLNSGNIAFESKLVGTDQASMILENKIEKHFGFHVDVIVRSATQWNKYISSNPFSEAAHSRPKHLHLGISKLPCSKDFPNKLGEYATGDEKIIVVNGVIWIDFAAGVARSKLNPNRIDKAAGSPVTLRNWNTVNKLQEMLNGKI